MKRQDEGDDEREMQILHIFSSSSFFLVSPRVPQTPHFMTV